MRKTAKSEKLTITMIPGNIDAVVNSFKVGRNVDVSGIIGVDFLDKYRYIIDFSKHRIRHGFRNISFKEAMSLLGIPYIVLWQNEKKFIFIIDTASSMSHVSSSALERMEYENIGSNDIMTVGFGGAMSSNGTIEACFTYKQA